MTSIETWYEKIDGRDIFDEVSGKDWDLRLIFADWLEDHDEPVLAAGQRWQVVHKKRPLPARPARYVWFDQGQVEPESGDVESDLSGKLLAHLKRGRHEFQPDGLSTRCPYKIAYASMAQAEADLA